MDIETLYRTILESPKIIKNEDDVTNDHLLELKQYIVSKDAELSAIAETVSPLCRDIDIAKALSVGLQRMALQLEQMSVIVDAEMKRREGYNNEPPKAEPPAFADLFVSAEAMQKALQAAQGIDPPMIYANDQWTRKYKELPGLNAFYAYCNDKDYLKRPTNKKGALDAFSLRFMSKKTGKNAPQVKLDSKLKERLILFDRS